MDRMWSTTTWSWKILLVTLSLLSSVKGLSGSQIWRVSNDSAGVVSDLEAAGILDVLHHSKNGRSFVVSLEHQAMIRKTLSDSGINFDVVVDDLDEYLNQRSKLYKTVAEGEEAQICDMSSCTAPLNNQYMSFQQMEWYLQYLNETHPLRVSVTSIGTSVEGRDIWMVNLRPEGCTNQSRNEDIKAIWLEGGIHAREWISPAVCLHFLHNLLHNCELSQHFDIYIVPESNPDGYEYSRESSNARLWRKNRSINDGSECIGVDLNRNWDFQYGVVGVSEDPCSSVYMGTSAFSEPETYALSTAMKEVTNLELYISIHSYGQLLLYPYGYTIDVTAPDTEEMVEKCEIFVDNLNKRFDNSFTCENAAAGLYFASGASDDWAKGVLGVKYAYTLELRDVSDGEFGFLLPEDQINPSVEETWDGLQAMLKSMITKSSTMTTESSDMPTESSDMPTETSAMTTESSAICASSSAVVLLLGLLGILL